MTETIIRTNLTTISNACDFYIDDLCECSKITETRRDITGNYYEFTIRRRNGDEFKYEVSGNEFCHFEYSDYTNAEWEYWVNNRIV